MFIGGRKQNTQMRFFPWQSRAAKNEKRDALEVQSNGFNLGTIWSFLDSGGRNNESDEVVNDATALAISTVYNLRGINTARSSDSHRLHHFSPPLAIYF
jgi:hypothetical protein